jgi:hypothetical protein
MFQQRQRLRWMWFVLFLAVTGFGLLWAESEVQGGSAHSLQQATIPGGSELFLPLVQPEPGSGAPATDLHCAAGRYALFDCPALWHDR